MKLTTALVGSTLFLGSFSSANADDVVNGQASVTFTKLYAVDTSTSPRYPQYDEVCNKMFGSLLNTTVNVDYSINTRTKIEYAYFNYAGTRTLMRAMGLSSSYSFIGPGNDVPALKAMGIRAFFYKMDNSFQNPSAMFTFTFQSEIPNSGSKYQCVLEG